MSKAKEFEAFGRVISEGLREGISKPSKERTKSAFEIRAAKDEEKRLAEFEATLAEAFPGKHSIWEILEQIAEESEKWS